MQRYLSILLVIGIFGQASIRTAWTLHYQWNRAAYLAKCVNKDKPYLQCNGQCAFMKEVAAREQKNTQEPRLPEGFREIKDLQLFFETPVFLRFTTSHFSVALELPPYQVRIPDAPVAEIFKPPA